MKLLHNIFCAALFLLASTIPAYAGVVPSGYGVIWITPPGSLTDVYDNYCDNGNIVNFSNGTSYIISGCQTTPTATQILPVSTGQITGLSTALAAKYDIPAGTTGQYVRGDGSLATFPTAGSRTFNTPSRTLSSCFQISATNDADFHYKVDVASGTLLQATATGTVTATSYTNSGCTTGARIEADGAPSQSAALGILSVAQTVPVGIDGTLEHGRWLKITTAQTVGTPTFAIRANQVEVIQP